MLTAASIERQYMNPALEARALNLAQARILLDPSVLEILKLLAAPSRISGGGQSEVGAPLPAHLATLAALTRRLAVSNQREGLFERQVAGYADRDMRCARDLALNRRGEAVLASKGIARAVRGPLRTIRDATGVDRPVLEAVRELDRILVRAPISQVLSPTVEHEIGARSFALLRGLLDEREDGL